MFDRILVPLDGSPEAEAIFEPLRDLCRRRDSELVLLQAVYIPTLATPEYVPPILADHRAAAVSYLAEAEARLESQGLRARSLVELGRPAEMILKTASATGATLIALSTHGRSGWIRWVLGSVTEEVLRRSPVPVLAWRARNETGSRRPERETILVPFDGDPDSLSIAPAAIEAAVLYGAGVALVKVESEGADGPNLGFVGLRMDGPMDPDAPGLLDRDLIQAGNGFAEAGVPTTLFRVRGEAADQIRRMAEILPARLIAMATHGRSGMARLVSGSVTERVVRTAGLPVLVVNVAAASRSAGSVA